MTKLVSGRYGMNPLGKNCSLTTVQTRCEKLLSLPCSDTVKSALAHRSSLVHVGEEKRDVHLGSLQCVLKPEGIQHKRRIRKVELCTAVVLVLDIVGIGRLRFVPLDTLSALARVIGRMGISLTSVSHLRNSSCAERTINMSTHVSLRYN
jgi:hypothetical protein